MPVKVLFPSTLFFTPAPICGERIYPSSSLILIPVPSQSFKDDKEYVLVIKQIGTTTSAILLLSELCINILTLLFA